MAARDDTYRNQRWLDIIFAASCLAMLASTIWMFADDYLREFKVVQRKGADIEVALLSQQVEELRSQHEEAFAKAKEKVLAMLAKYELELPEDTNDDNIAEQAKAVLREVTTLPSNSTLVAMQEELSALKAERDSLISERDLMVLAGVVEAAVVAKEEEIRQVSERVAELETAVQQLEAQDKEARKQAEEKYRDLADAVEELDKITRDRARIQRTIEQKRIGLAAKIRAWPILDAFSPPYRIRQTEPPGLLINYNFKQVQRADRCMTCHIFIDRPNFTRDQLAAISEQVPMTKGDYTVYASHPRLDLFVSSNSPHPVEKFGCTICHSGQGGAAEFNFAYHTPDSDGPLVSNPETYAEKKERWQNERHWHADLHPDYLWDFPMLPARFIESSCLKCHPQVLDLVSTDGRDQAPKVLKGYRLVRKLGCFGCHEISGYKSGRVIGPDLRLEPVPPLEELTAGERNRVLSDTENPPGQLRKVGPGLRRIAEKTNPDWTIRWIRRPRAFRPTTHMPHFYGLTNNTPGQLSDEHPDHPSQLPAGGQEGVPDQSGFPDAEIRAITFYLFKSSEAYLQELDRIQHMPDTEWAKRQRLYEALQSLAQRRQEKLATAPSAAHESLPENALATELIDILLGQPDLQSALTKNQLKRVLDRLTHETRWRSAAPPLRRRPDPAELTDADPNRGKLLFQNRGCLACHMLPSPDAQVYDAEGNLLTDADFGPSLQGLKEKLVAAGDQKAGAKWLFYWLEQPANYHPRTKMPNPQLTPQERADLVAWLLNGTGNVPPGPDWNSVQVSEGDLKGIAYAFLEKALPRLQAKEALESGLKDVSGMRFDSPERILATSELQPKGSPLASWSHEDRLRFYVGKKTIGRYGCYACHDIPGFDHAKPIGTPLNDWGKKDPDRLAFDNISEFIEEFHGDDYDPYFKDAFALHRREAFLYQKLRDPRSYDYEKLKDRHWDDRLKMPKFQFSSIQPRQGEDPLSDEFLERAARAEKEAIESVMTFILGLVAEEVPLKFVHQPSGDRLNEVLGLHVIERHNCTGCHIIKPGIYEVDPNYVMVDDGVSQKTIADLLYDSVQRKRQELERDTAFPEHASWQSQVPLSPDRIKVRGLPLLTPFPPEENEDGYPVISVENWEAIRVKKRDGDTFTFRAAQDPVQVPLNPAWFHRGPYGGDFAEILARILADRERKNLIGDRPYLMGSVPPPLIREGQKVQPHWLYDFLQKPIPIRPAVSRNLLMPQFNFGYGEIEKVVNYFIAVDRLENPALGLEYAARLPIQRQPEFQNLLRAEYRNRLRDLIPPGTAGLDPEGKDYFAAGWKILTNPLYCVNCHDVGTFKAQGKEEEKGPPLSMATDRIRPEYLERWISFPRRLVPYTAMQQYDPFYRPGPDYHRYMRLLGQRPVRPAVQWTGTLGSAPVGILPLPLPDEAYNELELSYALLPPEKARAVRDAIMSWGFLENPPPRAVQAGPRR